MKNHFYLNIILLLCINLLVKPLYIVAIDAEIQNQVGNSAYGMYFVLFNFVFVFQWVLDFGIQNYTVQALAKDKAQLASLVGTAASSRLLLSLVFTVITAIGATVMYGLEHRYTIGIIIFNMVLLSFLLFFRSMFSAMGAYLTDSLLSSLDKILLIFGLGYLLYFSSTTITINLFLLSQTLSLAIALVVVLFLFLRKYPMPRLAVDFTEMQTLVARSYPYALVFILMALYCRMDGIMLEWLVDDEAVSAGIYAACFRIFEALNILGFLFSSLLLPMFASVFDSEKERSALFNESSKALLVLSGIAVIALLNFNAEIVHYLYVDADAQYVATFNWLILSFYCVSYSYITGALISASSNLRKLNAIFIVGILINWTLNLSLIPHMQAEGAALATFITQASVVLGQLSLCLYAYKLDVKWKDIGLYCLHIVVLIAIFYAVKHYLFLHFVLKIILGAIIGMCYILLTKFLRLDNAINLTQAKQNT